ncbi:T9SS type A sorting domain-containing protein [Portibacter marinus]|uniref:T9SS type A sorting domain-containing protein n=1 Tax=Portibacter marinus TaxID=2898660 RepID=UPI001F31D2D3|nr:T9SS type A sorting domain-containing protein [Portibacter marinus]
MKRITFLLLCMMPMLAFSQVDLPITFEDTIDYMLSDFGGNASEIVVDPTDDTNRVGQATKNADQVWAGTTIGTNGLANPVPFDDQNTIISARVWSPTAGIPIRLKVENASDPGIAVEVEVMTTVAESWETLEFNFADGAVGTLNLANVYDKVSIFFNFGTLGTGETYFFDDIIFIGGGGITKSLLDLPITFEDTASVDYGLTDFGGNASMIVVDPTDENNLVGQATKTMGSEVWAGTTMGGSGLASAIPLTSENASMTAWIWSPTAGTPVRLKVENAGDPGISVETDALTTAEGEWEMLTFDFTQNAEGTAAIDFSNTYNKISIFFNFGTSGTGETYYWDNVMMAESGGSEKMQVDLPITFEDTASVDYGLTDFGGNASMIVVDPTDENNLAGQVIKTMGSEVWAGTTVGGSGLANAIPFDQDNTIMTVRVWSPTADTPIRLKVEDATNGGIFIEAETNTTVAEQWETLEFDFADAAAGILSLDNVYDKVSVFFSFGTAGNDETYFFDDIIFAGGGGLGETDTRPNFPITFEDTASIDYAFASFGGVVGQIVTDPTDESNLVGEAVKTDVAETWGGTVVGANGLAMPVPFSEENMKLSVRVWSPDANTPVLLKLENAVDAGLFVETLSTTTAAGEWETLEFDFANPAQGQVDFNVDYDKVVIFFNFGVSGGEAGEKTYYWDDMIFLGSSSTQNITFNEAGIMVSPNPARDFIRIEFENQLFQEAPLRIFDASGRLVRQQRISNNDSRINVSDLNSGIYYLNMIIADKNYIQKVSISK